MSKEKMLSLEEIEELLVNHADDEYDNIKTIISFAGNKYRMSINYAYLNISIDQILTKYGVKYDDSWMWTTKLNNKNRINEFDKLIRRLYDQNVDKLVVDKLLGDMVSLTTKLVHMFDSGKRVSLDLSIVGLANDVLTKPEVKELLTVDHIDDDMLPEDIIAKKEEILDQLKTYDIYGIKELLLSGAGVKADQVFNCIIGLWLRTRVHNMEDVAPHILHERWIDGITTRISHFIELNNNRMAAISSKDIIKDSGTENKHASTLSQDIYINGEDCHSMHGLKVFVANKRQLDNLVYKYQMMPDGSLREIKETDTHLIGQHVIVRSMLKCANKEGVCATCFGAHNKWNRHTKEYRKDLGSEFTKVHVSNASQSVLSFKHTITPDVVPVRYDIVNTRTGELTHDWSKIIDRKFNRITPVKGAKIYFNYKDIIFSNKYKKAKVTNNKIDPYDADYEYDEKDIIRTSKFFVYHKGTEYQVELAATVTATNTKERPVMFKVKGIERHMVNELYDVNDIINIEEDVHLLQVIPNKSRTAKFNDIQNLYANDTMTGTKESLPFESIEDMVQRTIDSIPESHLVGIEVLFRNKIKYKNDFRKRPDWTQPDAESQYEIISESRALNAIPTITSKLGLGYFEQRLKSPYYYDPANITPSAYDLLFDSFEEAISKDQYVEATETDSVDFYSLYGDNK